MTIEALILTRERPELLRQCLLSLAQAADSCSEVRLEVTIGINGEDPPSWQALDATKSQLEASKIHIQCLQLSKTTPAEARNQLLKQSGADWIFFIDDDVRVPIDFFKTFLATRARFPHAGIIGGPNLTPPNSSRFQRAAGLALAHRFATFISVARYRPSGSARPCDESSLILCNLFAHRKRLGNLNFHPALVCAEENWLLGGLSESGVPLIYDPRLWVWHERRPGVFSFARQVLKYGRGRGQCLRAKPGAIRFAHVLPSACLLYSAFIAVSVLATMKAYPALFLPYAFYALLCMKFALDLEEWTTALTFPIIHAYYGLGVLWGLLSSPLQSTAYNNEYLPQPDRHKQSAPGAAPIAGSPPF